MKDWLKKREDNLAELTLGSHIIAYLIAIIIFITGTYKNNPNLNTIVLLQVTIIMPAAIFILLDYHFMQRSHKHRVIYVWNIIKHTLLFIILTLILLYSRDTHFWLFAPIYLLPVALISITLGKKWGMVFAGGATGSVYLLSGDIFAAGRQSLGSVEAVLVLGGIFFLLAWFLGGILEVEEDTAEKIKLERDLLARIMDTSPAGILVLGFNREIIYVNTRVEEMLGLSSHEFMKIFKSSPDQPHNRVPEFLEEVFQGVLSSGKAVYNCLGTIAREGEKETFLSVSGAPVYSPSAAIEQVVLIFDDVTRQVMITEEMLKADKLESLGLLAGGIAHDFNNFLAIVLGNISLIKILNDNQKIAINLDHMEKAVLQARELTRKLFIFARGGTPARKTIRLQSLLLDTVGFALCGSAVTYEAYFDHDLKPIEADEAQIGQVVNNILLNAVQAMPQGGNIRIAAKNLFVDRNDSTLPLPGGDYICVEIVDEGIGIHAEQIGKIFDPFYSTKPKGSGLGLATAYTIVHSHGGLLRVESQPGSGSTFFIYLPASTSAAPESVNESEEFYFGEARVLIMDDEKLILEASGGMLKQLGCQVSYARDGNEAVHLYREAAEKGIPFDVVIIDLTIPGGVGGVEALEQLRRLNPEVKAIVSSGYSNAPIVTRYEDYGFSGYVNKPYRLKELSEALRKVLDPV